jgi:hypothetical protein
MYTPTTVTTVTYSPVVSPVPSPAPSTPSSSSSASTPTPVSSSISPQSEYTIKLLSGNEIAKCVATGSKMLVREMKQPSHTDSCDFPDLRFHVLHHNENRVEIIEAVKLQNNSITYQLLHLAPQSNLNTPKYHSNLILFTKLSKKFWNTYYSLKDKDKIIIKENPVIPNKKKVVVSSQLV